MRYVLAFSLVLCGCGGSTPPSLDVLAGTQAATTMRSTYQREVGPPKITLPKIGAVPVETDSRQIEMKPGAPLEVRLRGQGCSGLVIFSKGV